MALIVETGAGLDDANSYVSDEDAIDYLQSRGRDDEWLAVDVNDRESYLVRAADFLGLLAWRGEQLVYGQSMAFPRSVVDGIPSGIKAAQILLALEIAEKDGAPLSFSPTERTVLKERKKMDGVGEKEVEYAEPGRLDAYPYLNGMVGYLLQESVGSSIQVRRRLVG